MKVLRQIAELQTVPGPVALAIGVFDGVHLGHQAVIGAAVEHSVRHAGTAVVLTFDPHPLRVLRPQQAPRLLCSTRHKLRLLERMGITHAVVCTFDGAFARTPAAGFVEEMASSCQRLDFISVGYSWRFGAGGAGDIHLLMDLGQQHGFTVHGVPAVKVDDQTVSSTAIREAVCVGDFARAKHLLGRDYLVLGVVVPGRQLGRQLGIPTANLDVETEQLPPPGVYAARALVDGTWHLAVANLGHRPTVADGDAELSLEVHLIDFDQDLYGQEVEVSFVRRLRDEKKFASLDELKAQIARDLATARGVLKN